MAGASEASAFRHNEQATPPAGPFEYPQQPAAAAMLRDRARRVVLAPGEVPAATGEGGIAKTASVAFVLAVNAVVNDLWKESESQDEIKRRLRAIEVASRRGGKPFKVRSAT